MTRKPMFVCLPSLTCCKYLESMVHTQRGRHQDNPGRSLFGLRIEQRRDNPLLDPKSIRYGKNLDYLTLGLFLVSFHHTKIIRLLTAVYRNRNAKGVKLVLSFSRGASRVCNISPAFLQG